MGCLDIREVQWRTVGLHLPIPSRSDIVAWIQDSWSKVTGDMIRKAYRHVGLFESIDVPSSVANPEHNFVKSVVSFMEEHVDVEEDEN